MLRPLFQLVVLFSKIVDKDMYSIIPPLEYHSEFVDSITPFHLHG